MKFAAVIIDDRQIPEHIISEHMSHLPGWGLCVYTNKNYKLEHPHFRKPFSNGRADAYNKLLTDVSFWRELQEFERVLVFQQDSRILRDGVEEFLQYSYVGAPWREGLSWARKDRSGGNGGLSIREPSEMIRCIKNDPWNPRYGNEDVYFTHRARNVAPYEVCKRFSVETEFTLGSFGCHAIEKHLSESQCQQIFSQYTKAC